MTVWTYYDRRTGQVRGRRVASSAPVLRGDLAVIEGDHAGCYIDTETGKPAPLMEMAPEVTDNAISGLPDGAEIVRDGTVIAAGDAVLAVDFDDAVTVEVRHPRYRPVRLRVPCRADVPGDVRIEQDERAMRAKHLPDLQEQVAALLAGGVRAERMRQRVTDFEQRMMKRKDRQ